MSDEPGAKSEEGFAQRWARLKAEAREAKPTTSVPATPAQRPAEETARPFDLSKLPSIDSLTKDSDYSMFMRGEVPDELRRQALRKLWASDPVLAAPDPLDMHNLDYNAVFAVTDAVKAAVRTAKDVADAASAPEHADTQPDASLDSPESISEGDRKSPSCGDVETTDKA